ncbi:hypothetical protein ACHAXT_010368 [Thalassiosira profunda]
MEDNDDYEPNDSGHLDLRYSGWAVLEPRVLSFASSLLSLDLSFNQLAELPEELSKLSILQELNCACNKLQALPESIGSLAWLKIVKANGNCLSSLPASLGECKNLELLNASENALTSLPQEIAGCASLRTLLLQNNDLSRLPLSLASLGGQIQEIDVSNNNRELETTLPTAIHRDCSSIMWILALQQEKRHCIDQLKQEVKTFQHDNIAMEQELAKARERIAGLVTKKRVLEEDMESVQHFLVARAHCRELRRRGLLLWEEIKRACSQRVTSKLQR